MGIPLMIQESDNERIENLKKELHISKKIEVLRAALTLLEQQAERFQKVERWKRVAKLVAKSSRQVNKDFQKHSRMKIE